MDRWVGKTAVVTGASAGIGKAIAIALANADINVVGLARRAERVSALQKEVTGKGKISGVKCDLTKEQDIVDAFKWAEKNVGPVQILVNNAGLVRDGYLINGDTVKWQEILNTNILALAIATREAVQQMKKHNLPGHVVHINSVVGHSVPMYRPPVMNIYPASKHAVTALTESYRQEFNHFKLKIKITSVSPGYVTTEIFDATGNPTHFGSFDAMPSLRPEDVANSVLHVIGTPPHVQIHELTIRPFGEDY